MKRKLNPWFFSNIVWVIYGFPVDYFTGAHKKITQTYYEVNFTNEKMVYNFKNNFYVITKNDTFFTQESMMQKYGKLYFKLLTGEKMKIPLKELIRFKARDFEAYYGTIETKNTNIGYSIFEYRLYQPYFNRKKQKYALMALLMKNDDYSLVMGFHKSQSVFVEEYKTLDYYYVFKNNEFITKVTMDNLSEVLRKYFNVCDEHLQALKDPGKTKNDVEVAIKLFYSICPVRK